MKKTLYAFSILLIASISTSTVAAKIPLQIVSLSYHGKCVTADSIVTINLNKKIIRGYSVIAISGKHLHHHPKIIKWPFRSSSIKILIPQRSVLTNHRRFKISIERRLKHKTLSNKKSFRVCR